MAQPITSLMSGLALDKSDSPTPAPRPVSRSSTNPTTGMANAGAPGNRLPPALKKYMNPNLVRPPNSGVTHGGNHTSSTTTAYAESQRAPLLRLAGLNVPSPARNKHSSPTGKPSKVSITQHTAHGLHGPAHSTTARAKSSSINPHQPNHAGVSQIPRKGEIGKYDGGLEADAEGKEVTGDAGKILDMDSGSSSCVTNRLLSFVYRPSGPVEPFHYRFQHSPLVGHLAKESLVESTLREPKPHLNS